MRELLPARWRAMVCAAVLLAAIPSARAQGGIQPPAQRFHRDPESLPGVTLVPKKSAAKIQVPTATFDQFDRWAEGRVAGDGLAFAHARRTAMAQLIELDPAEALRRAVRDDVRAKLPANIAAEIEEPVRGIGSLLVVCALPADQNQPAEIQREVIVNGKHYRAFTSGKRLDQTCAKETPIFGIAIGDVLALEDRPYRQLHREEALLDFARAAKPVTDALTGAQLHEADIAGAIDEGDQIAFFGTDSSLNSYLGQNWTPYIAEFGGTAGGPGMTNAWTQGVRTYVAYRARLAEDATNYEPYAWSSGQAAFNTVSNWYYQWSYGSVTMRFVVVTNTYVFTNSGAWYESNGSWPKLLADARTASLGTSEAYTNFNFDSVTHNWDVGLSGYAGIAYVGGRGASFHEGYGAIAGVVGHEHGHNLGLPHNNFWDTAGQSIFGAGTHSEYGDEYDIMGDGYANWPFASNMRNRLSWLPDMHTFYNVTSGVYRLQAMDQFPLFLPDTNSPQNSYSLAMPKDGRNYVFEFREDTNRIGSNQSMLNGLFLEVDNGFGGGPELLDCTPGSSGGIADAMLTIGRMFTDPNANVHVTPIGRGPTSTTNWIDVVVNRNTQISNHPPAIAITASSYATAVSNAVTLTATASDPDGDDLAFFWDFGDGSLSYNNTNVQTKSWSVAGVFPVRCVVADMHGREASAQIQITVGAPAVYSISGRATAPDGSLVQGVRIASGGPTVFTDVDGRYVVPNLVAGSYTLTANGSDSYANNYAFTYSFANPITVGPSQSDRDIIASVATGTNIGAGTGFLYERWEGISGTAVSSLTNAAAYPNQPTVQRILKSFFEGPTDFMDNYGTRMRAIYTAPLTGTYYFFIAADDTADLWFSTTTNPVAATKIAYLSSYTASRTWTTYASQKSAAIALTAGQKCYIEALHKEGSGGDNIAVGADLPDGSQEKPIPFHRLDPWLAGFSLPPTSVSIAATDAIASEPGTDTATFTLTRAGDAADPLVVTFQLTGTAQYDVDYVATGLTATFAAGETQTVVTITPKDDAISEPVETVTATVIPGTAYAVASPASATISIYDNEATTVTVSAPDPVANESGDSGRFLISRNGVATGTITVALAISGTASNGVDFPALPSSVTIPAGSSTATVVVSPIADGIAEIAETVILTALGGAGYAVGSPSNATVTITADPGPGTGILREWWTGVSGTLVSDLTSNSNYPATPTGSEILTNLFECPISWADNYGTRCRGYFVPPVSGAYYFYIASDDTSELWLGTNSTAGSAVKIAYVGSYTASRAWTTYASQKSAAINLVTGQTYYIEALQKEGSGGDNLAVGVEFPGGYQEMPIPYHRLLPFDTQKPTVNIFASDPSASEAGDTGSVLVVRSSEGIAQSLAVSLSYGGTATFGVDYAAMPTQVVFGANVTNMWLQLTPVDDALLEGVETAEISIVNDASHFFLGAATNAVISIADDEMPSVTVAATSPYAYEAGPTSSTFVISRSGSLTTAVTVDYTLGGTATPGSDFVPLPGYFTTNGSVTLAAGQASTNIVLMPVNDSSAEGPETVVFQLSPDPLYAVGSPASATITILDDDVPPVIVLNSPASPGIRIPPGVGLILDATITHNGLPNPPSAVTQRWAQTSGPTNAALATSNDWKNATATFPMIGTYVLQLTAVAGAQTASTNITIAVGTFTNGAPLAWTNANVGYLYPPTPTYSVTNGTNSITVAGDNSIYSGMTYDDFGSVMAQVPGNCSVTARVVSVQSVLSGWSRAGVIMRESLDKSSKSAFMGLAAGSGSTGGGKFDTRATYAAANAQTSVSSLTAPYWMRLDRTGNVFRAFRSSTGTSWTQVGSDTTITMSNTIYVGIAASSGLTNSAGTFKFSGLGISGAGAGGVASNVGPNVSAGAAASANLPNPATLSGGASDDGLPNPPAAMSFAWAKVSGPGIVTFGNSAATNTTATFDTPGNYSLRLVANDGQIKTFSDTTVAATGFGVRIIATDPFAASPGTNTATFVITRDGPTNASLTVNLGIGGTAVPDFDYIAIPTQAVIAAGESNATVTVNPIDFYVPRDTVSVAIAIAPSAAYAIESQSSDTVFISNTNLPIISVVASDPNASEPPGISDTGAFTFTRVGGTNYPLTVSFDVLGTAAGGVDFVPLTNAITFATGATSATITVTPLDHVYGSVPLTVIASLSATDGTYAAGIPANATVTITNKNFFALHLVWNGATNNSWDIATTPNWFAADIAAPNTVFSNSYSVTFDDTPGVTTTVSIATNVQPVSVTVNASTNRFTFSGPGSISGSASLTKDGTNVLVIATNQNFSGATTISNGTLQVGAGTNSGSLGSSAVQIKPAATLSFFRSDSALAITNSIGGNGTLNLKGTGVSGQSAYQFDTANPSFSGQIVVNNARLQGAITNAGSASMISTVDNGTDGGQIYFSNLTNAIPLTLAGTGWQESAGRLGAIRSENATINGPITLGSNARIGSYATSSSAINGTVGGNFELEFWCGSGTQTFTLTPAAANSNGSLRVSSNAVVVAGNTNAFSPGPLVMNGGIARLNGNNFSFASLFGNGVVQNGSTNLPAVITIGAANSNTSYSGTLLNGSVASLGLTKIGTATQIFTAVQSLTGPTTINGGTILLTGPNAANSGIYASPITINGGTLIAGGANSLQGSSTAGAGTITINAGGTMTTSNGVTAHVRGVVTLAGGTLASATPDATYGSWNFDTNVVVNGGTNSSAIPALNVQLTRSGGVVFDVSPGAANGIDLNVTGNFANPSGGTGALIKNGSGVMALGGTNTYTGPTIVSNGALIVNGILATGTATIVNGAALGGSGVIKGIVTNAGVISPGATATNIGVLTISNSYSQTSAGTLAIAIGGTNGAGAGFDQLKISGAATLGGTLALSLTNGFAPAVSNSFRILTAGSIGGAFAATNLPPLAAHQSWEAGNTTTSVTFTVAFGNSAPSLTVPGPHILALGATTNFAVTAGDPDGDSMTVSNKVKPAGAVFTNGIFSWTAALANWNSTNAITFVATDSFGASSTNSTVIIVPYDANTNGVPDNWEWQNTGSLTNSADAVLSSSGFTLAQNYVAGTSPTNPSDYFHAIAITGTPSFVSIPTVSGRIYRVWYADGPLGASPGWNLFSNQINGIGSWLETNPPPAAHGFADDCGPNTSGHAPTNGVRFYRLDVRLAP